MHKPGSSIIRVVGFQAQDVRHLAANHSVVHFQIAAPIDSVLEGSRQTHAFNACQTTLQMIHYWPGQKKAYFAGSNQFLPAYRRCVKGVIMSGGVCSARGTSESCTLLFGSPRRVLEERRCRTLGTGDLMDRLLRLLLTCQHMHTVCATHDQ
ncbi:MAG: hypothetical protein FRX49_00055 [Trebouxia sp. A1-2]|nr:MAG: hypothetical protein FRX49_00055 [Trebouxia sp. A1-2]